MHGVAEIDRVLDDVDLAFEVGGDVDRRVGDDERLVVPRHVHHEAVTDSPRGSEASVPLDHRTHQLVGMKAALHQRLGSAFTHQLDRLFGGFLAVFRIDDLEVPNVEPVLLGDRSDPLLGAHQNRLDEIELCCLDDAFQRRLVARVRHCDVQRRMLLRSRDERVKLLVRVLLEGGFGF